MKIFGVAVGLMALFAGGTAGAGPTVLFNTLVTATSPATNDSKPFYMNTGALNQSKAPLAISFNVPGPTSISSVSMRLADTANTDGGSILVYLVPNQAGGPVTAAGGLVLPSSKVLLGSILDSALPTSLTGACALVTSCDTTLTTNAFVAAGTYWIALVNGNDVPNGGSVDKLASGAGWWNISDGVSPPSVGTVGQSNVHVDGAVGSPTIGQTVITADTARATFEAQVTSTPEPASMAVLGVSLLGLGLLRRGKKKSST